MNPDYEKQLAVEIDRELKALPELEAPAGLLARVMAAIEHPVLLPWYRRAWQTWSTPLQAAAIVVLAAFLGGVCFGAWEFSQSTAFSLAMHKVSGWFSSAGVIWNALNAVGGVAVLAFKQLGTGFLIACLAAVALAWAACVGLGTVYVRLAFARH